MSYVRTNRKQQRDELQATWSVYDALRPIRMAVPPQPETATHAAKASPAPHGGALTLMAPEDASHFEAHRLSDDEMRAAIGPEVWDAMHAEMPAQQRGTLTITGIDRDAGTLTVEQKD